MANWADDTYERDLERDWMKYEKPDLEDPEEAYLRMLVEDERQQILWGRIIWSS